MTIPIPIDARASDYAGRELDERVRWAADERVRWAAEVRRGLQALSATQREVLTLSYFAQMSQPDIALRLGISLDRVQAGVASGLRQLGSLLEIGANQPAT